MKLSKQQQAILDNKPYPVGANPHGAMCTDTGHSRAHVKHDPDAPMQQMKLTVVRKPATGVRSCSLLMIFVFFVSLSMSAVQADLATDSQNPISSLINVPFEFNNNFNTGPEDAYFQELLIEPVIPVKLNENWTWIHRGILPVLYQEGLLKGQEDLWGLGDFTYQGYLSPAKAGKLIWGIGPSVVAPLGTNDRFSSNKWSIGPNVVLVVIPGKWVIGVDASQVWDVAGDSDAESVSFLSVQPFVNYNLNKGWFLTTAPMISADWEADSSQTWTVPVGGGVGKVLKIGKQNLSLILAGYYNVESPDFGSDYDIQFTVTFMFPK